MQDELPDIIELILHQNTHGGTPFCKLLEQNFLKAHKIAIYVDSAQTFLLSSNDSKPSLCLFDILSTLKYLEQERLIYCIKPTYQVDPFYYKGSVDVIAINEEKFTIDQDNKLIYVDGRWEYHDKNDGVFTEWQCLSGDNKEQFDNYLFAHVFPTSKLVNFVERQFLTEEQFNTKESLQTAHWANGIAICLALLTLLISPLINVYVNNEFGYSTIKQSQYNKLINKPDIVIQKDTILFQQKDTINCIIIKDKTQSNK